MSTFQMARQALSHPLDFFYDIQFMNRAKWHQALIMIGLAYFARITSLIILGFSFETRESYQISAVLEGAWIVAPWITWVIANWAVSTILDGEGKFKEIFVGSAFTLTPFIVLSIPISIITNVLSLEEKGIYLSLSWFMYIWVVLLILLKVKIIHDFENGKMLWISFLTIVAVFIIWFIGLLMFGLVSQCISFIGSLIKEISFRL